MKTYTIGDIHGAWPALIQCLERSKFNINKDRLIILGDVCDGYPDVKKCIDTLLSIKKIIFVIGNHDVWALDWMCDPYSRKRNNLWLYQGGKNTKKSYQIRSFDIDGIEEYYIPEEHIEFLRDNSYKYYKDKKNRIFIHGGFNPSKDIKEQRLEDITWDRDLFRNAHWKYYHGKPETKYGGYEEIFIGHTTTQAYKKLEPINVCNVWNLDTGAGWNGKLTIMNVDTKEYWQSDLTPTLYPECQGRN